MAKFSVSGKQFEFTISLGALNRIEQATGYKPAPISYESLSRFLDDPMFVTKFALAAATPGYSEELFNQFAEALEARDIVGIREAVLSEVRGFCEAFYGDNHFDALVKAINEGRARVRDHLAQLNVTEIMDTALAGKPAA